MTINKLCFIASLVCFIVALIAGGPIPWAGLGLVFLAAGHVA